MTCANLKKILPSADILFIVPPFLMIDQQSVGVHILKAVAEQEGMRAHIFYANLHFASLIGDEYNDLCHLNFFFPGEGLFSRAAYGKKKNSVSFRMDEYHHVRGSENAAKIGLPIYFFPSARGISSVRLKEIEEKAFDWVREVAGIVAEKSYGIIGCTSNMEQTNAGFALLKGIKELVPETITLFGGFNCQGDLARGIASLDPRWKIIDYIFSGESEGVFADFIRKRKKGIMKNQRILYGKPVDLETIPEIDYSPYIEQLFEFLPLYREKEKPYALCYETSRGCWWGEKQKCLFCGHDRDRIHYRQKSASKVLADIRCLKKYPVKYIQTTDLIMPRDYFDTLLPQLAGEKDMPDIYYEQKLPLTLTKLRKLKQAHVTYLQPGLETFIDPLLTHMKKGVTARQNIMFLRYALTLEITPLWNFIWGFPGEKITWYTQMISFLPLLFHLQPPVAVFHLAIARFSCYFYNYEAYGIRSINPLESYGNIYPEYADIHNLALMYSGDYDAETYDDRAVINTLIRIAGEWNERWSSYLTRPRLLLKKEADGSYLLYDTRKLPGTEFSYRIDESRGKAVILSGPYNRTPEQEWALSVKAAIVLDDRYVPLATTTPELMEEFGVD